MKLFETPAVLLFLAVLVILHFVSLVARGKTATIFSYVNIFLHILLFVPMLANKFSIEEAVLVYMISFFMYTLFGVIDHRISVRKKEKINAVRARFLAAREASSGKEENV